MTETDEPKFKWMTLHGQRVRVQICPPKEARAGTVLTELQSDPKADRYEQRGVSETPHHGGHSHPCGYEEDDDAEIEGQIRHTRGSWAAGWNQSTENDRSKTKGEAMNHHELNQLGSESLPGESEEQKLFRLERAKRLMELARKYGSAKVTGISLDQLALLPPGAAVARLGLPPGVLIAELRRLSPPIPPVPPLPGR